MQGSILTINTRCDFFENFYQFADFNLLNFVGPVCTEHPAVNNRATWYRVDGQTPSNFWGVTPP